MHDRIHRWYNSLSQNQALAVLIALVLPALVLIQFEDKRLVLAGFAWAIALIASRVAYLLRRRRSCGAA